MNTYLIVFSSTTRHSCLWWEQHAQESDGWWDWIWIRIRPRHWPPGVCGHPMWTSFWHANEDEVPWGTYEGVESSFLWLQFSWFWQRNLQVSGAGHSATMVHSRRTLELKRFTQTNFANHVGVKVILAQKVSRQMIPDLLLKKTLNFY